MHLAFPPTTTRPWRPLHGALTEAVYRDDGLGGGISTPVYGTYVLDPDGNSVEIVNHNR